MRTAWRADPSLEGALGGLDPVPLVSPGLAGTLTGSYWAMYTLTLRWVVGIAASNIDSLRPQSQAVSY